MGLGYPHVGQRIFKRCCESPDPQTRVRKEALPFIIPDPVQRRSRSRQPVTKGCTMRTKASLILGTLLLMCAATSAWAISYPPGTLGGICNGAPFGPGCPYPDTLYKVSFIQNPGATPHPVQPDTVEGVAGIIIGFDTFPTGFGFYIQNSEGGPWSGVDVFTGGTNYVGLFTPNLALGDSVVCYGRLEEFQGGLELRSYSSGSAFNNPLPAVRRISTGNPLPKFFRGTANQIQELPTNVFAEQYEGTLVRLTNNTSPAPAHKYRVVRNSLQPGGIGTFSSMIVVDNVSCPNGSLGPCDSVFIDGSTLSFNAVTPLPLAALIDSAQGVYEQRTRGYRIQLRDALDLFDSSPPSITDAYFITADSIRVVFDRFLTQASAENKLNYTIASTLGPPDGAVRQVATNIVHLKVTTGLSPGDAQGVTVNGVVNSANNQPMTQPQSRTMFEGIVPITQIQAPDAGALGGSPCVDRSLFAGAGATNGDRITTRGVCTAVYGSTYFLQTAAGGLRSGLQLFAPVSALTVGRQYVLAGAIVEFFGETQMAGNVYVRDEGVVAPPAPVVQTIGVLRDTTCDASQSSLNSEDYEGMLVRVVDVKTTEERTAGQSFGVAGPYPTNPDTILIDNNITRTFDPQQGQYVTVTGVLEIASTLFAGSPWRIQPRGNSDITTNPTLGVDPLPTELSFAMDRNPSRSGFVTFALPKRDKVNIAVYDISGRKLAVLADNAEFPAGQHTLEWNGLDSSGKAVGAGVYFYKLRVAGQTLSTRGILLD